MLCYLLWSNGLLHAVQRSVGREVVVTGRAVNRRAHISLRYQHMTPVGIRTFIQRVIWIQTCACTYPFACRTLRCGLASLHGVKAWPAGLLQACWSIHPRQVLPRVNSAWRVACCTALEPSAASLDVSTQLYPADTSCLKPRRPPC